MARDAQLGEDAHRYANRIGAPVFACLRSVVMNLLRRGGYHSICQGLRELAYDIRECWRSKVWKPRGAHLDHTFREPCAETRISSQQLQLDLAFWIGGYYNREQRHSALGYLSQIDY